MASWNLVPFGKYQMKFFDEIDDYKYLCWYISKLNNECQIRHCALAIIKAVDKKRNEKFGRWEEIKCNI